jgi:hypothetical protein
MTPTWDESSATRGRMAREPSLLTKRMLNRKYVSKAKPHLEKMVEILRDLVESKGHKIALPFFRWRDLSRLGPVPNQDLVRWYDPFPLVTPLYAGLARLPDNRRGQLWHLEL